MSDALIGQIRAVGQVPPVQTVPRAFVVKSASLRRRARAGVPLAMKRICVKHAVYTALTALRTATNDICL